MRNEPSSPAGRRPKRPWTVVVTGASVGIGLAIARRLMRTEHRVVLTARRSSLSRFAEAGIVEGSRVLIRPLDVTSAAERAALVEEIVGRFGAVDVLINNAGLMTRSVVEHVTDEERRDQFAVNFSGPMALIRLVLPAMRAQRFGRIVSVSSVGGMTAMPTMAVYSGSKFALEGAHESLYYEVRPWGIAVSLVEPGFIRSDGFQKALYTRESAAAVADPADAYHAHYRGMERMTAKLMQCSLASPDSVARRIVRTALRRSPPLRVAGTWDAIVFSLARRLLPQRLFHEVLYRGLPDQRRWGPGR